MTKLPDFINDYGKAIFLSCGYDVNDSEKQKKQGNKSQFVKLDTRKGFYFFKDFGGGGLYLTPLSLLMDTYNIDYKDAIVKAKQIYNVATNDEKTYIDNKNLKEVIRQGKLIKEAKNGGDEGQKVLKDIRFNKQFTTEQIEFFKVKGNVSKEVSEFYFKSLQSSTIKKIYKNGSEYNFNKVVSKGLVFAIEIVEGECYRIIDKTTKKVFTLPNLDSAKEHIDKDYVYSLGIEQLNPNEKPILVGGETDFAAMKTQGFNVFTLGGETPNIPLYIAKKLKEKGFDLCDIIVCYDTDFAGRRAAQQLYKKHNCKIITLSKLETQYYQKENKKETYEDIYGNKGWILNRDFELEDAEKPKHNDICDYYSKYRFDSEFMNAFGCEKPFLSFGKRLSEATNLDSLYMETSKCKKTIWQVPTASGKTTVACSYDFNKFGSDSFGFFGYTKIHKENSIFIYTAPLTTIIEDLKEHYPNFQVVCEGHINAHAAKFVDTIITYNSLPTFLKRLKDNDLLKDVVLVVDEIHEVVQSSGYQNIAEMQSIFNQVSHVVGMSATISNIQECFNDFNILRCERKDNPVVNINLHIVEESKVLDTIMKCSIDSKDDNVLIFRNSKKIGSKSNVFQINEALKQEGINSDVLTGGMRLEEKRNNKAYQSLIKTNRLPKDCNFLVSTSVLSTGVTAYVDKIIYVATRTRDITAFMQSYARDRSDNIEVELILVREKTAKKDLPINLDITSIFERCQASARLANKSKLANDFIYKEHPELKEEPKTFLPNNLSDEIKKFVYFDRFTDKFEVNRYKIFNERYKDFCNNMSTDTYIKLIQELVPNCTIVEVKDDTIYENSEQVAEILVHQKELLASDTTSLKTIMKDDGKGNPVAENVFHTTDNDKVKESVKTYSYISSFLNVGAKKGYVLNADLLNPKPKIDSDLEIELCAMIEKRMELERKISVSKSDKSIKTYTKQLSKLQDKLDTKTKQSEYLRQFENEPLINVVKRNFEHLQVFFLRFKALKNALKDAIPFEMLVDICMDTNRTNYGTLLKQLYHNAAIEAYDLAKLNTKKLKQDDSFFEQKMESIEFDLKVIKFVSKKECSVNDFLNKFRGDAYTEKNLKRKLSVLFTDIDISTLYICAKRLDLAQLIGEENKDKYLNNFKNSL